MIVIFDMQVPLICMVTFSGMGGLVRVWGTKAMRSLPAVRFISFIVIYCSDIVVLINMYINQPKLSNAIWGAGIKHKSYFVVYIYSIAFLGGIRAEFFQVPRGAEGPE